MSRFNIETDMTPEQIKEFAKRLLYLSTVVDSAAENMLKSNVPFMTIENLASGHLGLDRLAAFLSGLQKGNIKYAKEPLPSDPRLKKKAETAGKKAKKS